MNWESEKHRLLNGIRHADLPSVFSDKGNRAGIGSHFRLLRWPLCISSNPRVSKRHTPTWCFVMTAWEAVKGKINFCVLCIVGWMRQLDVFYYSLSNKMHSFWSGAAKGPKHRKGVEEGERPETLPPQPLSSSSIILKSHSGSVRRTQWHHYRTHAYFVSIHQISCISVWYITWKAVHLYLHYTWIKCLCGVGTLGLLILRSVMTMDSALCWLEVKVRLHETECSILFSKQSCGPCNCDIFFRLLSR